MSDITYCSRVDCVHVGCSRHQDNATDDRDLSIADLNDGLCYDQKEIKNNRARLLQAICNGTQKTNYKCDAVCKAMCGNDGTCVYCAAIADAVEEEFGK
jgi:hypothetical protein